jgi:hypothetical protein
MEYYTYIWYRTDKEKPEPFYVGKGKGKRFEKYHNKHFDNIVKKHEKLGIKPLVGFYYKGPSEEMAYKNEMALIAKFGRKCLGTGPLINLTEGGEGGCPSGDQHWNYGKKASKEMRKKLSLAHLGIKPSEDSKKKNSESNKGKHNFKHTKESIEKMSRNRKGIEAWNKGKTSEVISNVKSQNWVVIFPDSHEEQIKNLTKFCKEYKLNQGKMSSVASGKRKQHKGFKCKKLEVIDA